MHHETSTPPVRPETAGAVNWEEGDVDRDFMDTSLTALEQELECSGGDGGTPGDAAGESGDPGA